MRLLRVESLDALSRERGQPASVLSRCRDEFPEGVLAALKRRTEDPKAAMLEKEVKRAKRYRHLNFFPARVFSVVRAPRVKLPDGSVRLVEPDWAGRLKGFTRLFKALVADAELRAVIFVTEGKDSATVERLAAKLRAHGGDPEKIESVSIDMSRAFIKGCEAHLPNARITFDKFHVIAQAS